MKLATTDSTLIQDLTEADRGKQLAAQRRLAELSAEWGLPVIPELTSDDVSADVLQAAVMDQVEYVEARVAKIAPGGNIKKWKNREKMHLPIFFHTPTGRETLKRLIFASRFPQHEIALICGLREEQLNAFVRGMGWDKAAVAVKRQRDMSEYRNLLKYQITHGKLKVAEAAFKAADSIAAMDGSETLKNLNRLHKLNDIMDDILPPMVDELGNKRIEPEAGCAVNIGVEIVGAPRKKFDPVEAAKKARATELEPENQEE